MRKSEIEQFRDFIYNEELDRIRTKTRDQIPEFYTNSILGMTLLKDSIEIFSNKILDIIEMYSDLDSDLNFYKALNDTKMEVMQKMNAWNDSTINKIQFEKSWHIILKTNNINKEEFSTCVVSISKNKNEFLFSGEMGSIKYNDKKVFIFENRNREKSNNDPYVQKNSHATYALEKKDVFQVEVDNNLENITMSTDDKYLQEYAGYLLRKFMLSLSFPLDSNNKAIHSNFNTANILENMNFMQHILEVCDINKIDKKILESEIFKSQLIGKKFTDNLITELKEAVDITFLSNDIDLRIPEIQVVKPKLNI